MESERNDFLVYLQQDNARLRTEVDELRSKREHLSTPRENRPPDQMIPTGRKVYTNSQLRQKAKDILIAGYKKEAENA